MKRLLKHVPRAVIKAPPRDVFVVKALPLYKTDLLPRRLKEVLFH